MSLNDVCGFMRVLSLKESSIRHLRRITAAVLPDDLNPIAMKWKHSAKREWDYENKIGSSSPAIQKTFQPKNSTYSSAS